MALRALYTDPNLSMDGLWRPQSSNEAYPVRLIRTSPQAEFDIGGTRIVTDSIGIETAGMIYIVQASPTRIMDGKIWRLDVRLP